jgi:hypothetical protein
LLAEKSTTDSQLTQKRRLASTAYTGHVDSGRMVESQWQLRFIRPQKTLDAVHIYRDEGVCLPTNNPNDYKCAVVRTRPNCPAYCSHMCCHSETAIDMFLYWRQ